MDRLAASRISASLLRVESTRDPGVAWIELANPSKMNCLSVEMMNALEYRLAAVAQGAAVVAITAQGENFCAGFDIHDESPLSPRFLKVGKLLAQLRDLEALTVAVVQGKAIGAGADLATHCDLRIALTGSSFRFPGFQKFGVVLGSARLREIIGVRGALEAMALGKVFDAEEALAVGLADDLVSDAGAAHSYVAALGAHLDGRAHGSTVEMVRALRTQPGSGGDIEQLARSVVAADIT